LKNFTLIQGNPNDTVAGVTTTEQPAESYPRAFQSAVGKLLGNEGGYNDDPADPGGETNWGICKRNYPALAIKSLTRAQAIAIYYCDWWQRYHYSDLPAPIGAKVFDLAVNVGPEHAMNCLQRALRACGKRVEEDGANGPATRFAARAANQAALLAALRSEAAGYYRELAAIERGRPRDSSAEFLRGWLNRAYE
jgi:lysozyme family protein